MSKTEDINNKEGGFASIVIALVLILILALLTIGFAQLARREQQNSLDKQLAVQATDAAESGINDVYKDISSGVITDTNNTWSPTTCMTKVGSPSGTSSLPLSAASANQTIDPTNDVYYTCVLVDMEPPYIQYSDLSSGNSETLTFQTSAPTDTFTVNWGSSSGVNSTYTTPAANDFYPYTQWNSDGYPAVLQISITPLSTLDRNSLINNNFNAYLYPSNTTGGTYNIASGNGAVVRAYCNASNQPDPCRATLTGFNASSYAIHIIDYYDTSDIVINGSSGGTPVKFIDGQAQIDVTGKAKNVLKRLRVMVPINPKAPIPTFAVEGQNICKREATEPTSAPPPNNTTNFVSVTGGNAVSGDPCYLQ